jgi:peptidoglycan hydrolase-like protein with peptidoglycan-binding domain
MVRKLIPTLVFVVALLPGLASADELTAIIQKDLQTLGYDPGGTDGEVTVKTAVAVSKFQADNGMEVTGEITPQLAGVIKATISKQGQAAPVAKAAPTPVPAGMDPAALAAMMQAQGGAGAGMDPAAIQAMMQAGMDPAAMQAMMAQMQGGAAMDPAMLQAMQMQAAQAQQAQAAQAQSAQQACLQQKIAAAQQAQEAAKKKRGFGSLMRAVSRLGGEEIAASVAGVSSDLYEVTATINDLESAARDLGLTEEEVAACGAAQ